MSRSLDLTGAGYRSWYVMLTTLSLGPQSVWPYAVPADHEYGTARIPFGRLRGERRPRRRAPVAGKRSCEALESPAPLLDDAPELEPVVAGTDAVCDSRTHVSRALQQDTLQPCPRTVALVFEILEIALNLGGSVS
jgi:hypothetical protein